jgi:hypothetical protein
MDRFTEELVKAGVLVAGAGLKNRARSGRALPGTDRHVDVSSRAPLCGTPSFDSPRPRIR